MSEWIASLANKLFQIIQPQFQKYVHGDYTKELTLARKHKGCPGGDEYFPRRLHVAEVPLAMTKTLPAALAIKYGKERYKSLCAYNRQRELFSFEASER